MKKIISFLLIVIIIVPLCLARIYEVEDTDYVLYAGQTHAFFVQDLTRIAIGKPEILDVLRVVSDEMVVVAKSAGETNLVWWDKFGEHKVNIVVYAQDMTKLKKRIDAVLDRMNISTVDTEAVDSENKIFLTGQLKNLEEKQNILGILQTVTPNVVDLIKVREDDTSVELEVQVLEVSEDAAEQLGFTPTTGVTVSEAAAPAAVKFSDLFRISDWSRTPAFANTLDLLIQEDKARVLSRPRLLCRSGKEAKMLVGGEVPVFSTSVSDAGDSTSVSYVEYGIKFNIKPVVLEGDIIDLELKIEISEPLTAEILGQESNTTAQANPISKRNIETFISMRDGQMLSIGGLIKQKDEETLKKLPWLSDIPVLGAFFRSRETNKGGGAGARGNTELYVTITAKVVPLEKRAKKTNVSVVNMKKPTEKEAFMSLYKNKKIPRQVREYVYSVQKKIIGRVAYPMSAVDTGWEGHVVVSLVLDPTGSLQETALVKSSGYKVFDDNAIELVKNLRYPPFPKNIQTDTLSIEVPIVYRIQR